MCLHVSLPPLSPCHDPHAIWKLCHVVGQSVSLTASLGSLDPGSQSSPVPGGPARRPHRVCFIPVSLATWGLMPSFLPCNCPAGCSCDVPSVRLSGHWPRPPQTPVSPVSPEPCVLHLPCGLCVGRGLGAGPGSIWVDDWGLALALTLGHRETVRWGAGCCHVDRSLMEVWQQHQGI